MAHITRDKKQLITRVRRIAGQVASLERALEEEEEDCSAILQRVASVRGAAQGLMAQLLEGHLRDHVAANGAHADELEPVLTILRSYLR